MALMPATESIWQERIAALSSHRGKQPSRLTLHSVAAQDLCFGDRFLWADQVLTFTDARVVDDVYMIALCSNGTHRVHLDLHRREEILTLHPSPTRETA